MHILEVLSAFSEMYLREILHIQNCRTIGKNIWDALEKNDLGKIVSCFNDVLEGEPYSHIKHSESLYHLLFVMFLRCVGIVPFSEVQTIKGRSDIVIQHKDTFYVIEFKFAKQTKFIEKLRKKATEQMKNNRYVKSYSALGKKVISAVFIVDNQQRRVVMQ